MKFSVCIPVYNMEFTIERAIHSALTQKGAQFEVIVVDNCSTDRTFETASRVLDSRLRVVRNATNVGAYGNHNRCIELATGEWIKFLHGDDELLPHCLLTLAENLSIYSQHPIGLVGMGACRIDGNGVMQKQTYTPQKNILMKNIPVTEFVLEGNFFGTPTMVCLNRKKLIELGGFDLEMDPAGDGDAWINLRCHFPSLYLANCLVIIRDDPPGTADQQSRLAISFCNQLFRQVKKWHLLDSHWKGTPLHQTPYQNWIIKESFRFWDASILLALSGNFKMMSVLFSRLLQCHSTIQSILFYFTARLTGKKAASLRSQQWETALARYIENTQNPPGSG